MNWQKRQPDKWNLSGTIRKMGKTILITGTSKGLGLALAKNYLDQDSTVIGVSRTPPPLNAGNYSHLCASLVEEDFHHTLETFLHDLNIEQIDIVINNAGSAGAGAHLSEVEPGDVLEQIQLHCVGALKVIKAAQPYLAKGKIINVTSRLGSVIQAARGDFKGRDFSYGYRIAKCAQNMLALCLAGDPELAELTIVSINPGLLLTDCAASDAEHSAEEGATRCIAIINEAETSGIYHAFGDEALY